MKKKWLPDHVTEYKDRHGKTRYRYRRSGHPVHHFRSEPGTPDFMAEYKAACEATPVKIERYAVGTLDALAASFYATPKWRAMRPSSKNTYQRIIDRFRLKYGKHHVRNLTAAKLDAILGTMSATPAAANNLRKILRRLMRHAIKLGWIKTNPVDATDAYKMEGEGFHTWTEDEIDQYEAHWSIGTRERLAMSLMLYTALRRSDMVFVGPEHRKGNKLILHHSKNSSDTIIPLVEPLREAIDAMGDVTGTYLQTQFGKPFTANGFGNWFRRRCTAAGLPHCTSHGLRKAITRRLAESHATHSMGKAVTGHKTDRMFSHYANKANQEGMAADAMANLATRFAKKDENNG